MFFRILLAVSIFITSFHICEAAEKVTVEESTLTKDEIRMFKSIAKFDKNFHYSKKARRRSKEDPGKDTDISRACF